ncbi:MAG TPA: LuxR C-terminal-related transcriptional regulator [Blastocatellia bacterium]|nr:LuxR C-terminal-related transcriptional regulator [Blastocatellia bacterium]
MRIREIKELVESTSDSAFAVDGEGLITAWNRAAADLFGLSADEAIGKPCGQILQGTDECGLVCSRDCTVRQSVQKHHPVGNFDLQVNTRKDRQWCNVSVLIAEDDTSTSPYAIHIVRPIDVRKRLELLMRDFIVTETALPAEQVTTLISSTRAPARDTELSDREIEVLRLLAKGATTASIAAQLHISRTTVNNHIQHILRKLNAHTRLEAIRRAEHAGLI